MQKHTPGPWTLDQCNSGWALLANGQDITAEPFDATDADARLIAAAPELLAALEDVIGLAERGAKAGNDPEMTDLWMRGQIANARAVIAKLEG